MKVKNINGTRDNTCTCGSWLNHWLKYSGQVLPRYCAEVSCVQKPEVGAHVQKESSTDASWYIVPLCNMHNAQTGQSLYIRDNINFASASVSNTCGKN